MLNGECENGINSEVMNYDDDGKLSYIVHGDELGDMNYKTCLPALSRQIVSERMPRSLADGEAE